MKACPFCRAAGQLAMAAKLHFVECPKCGAGSEPTPTEALAIANWEKRVRSHESRPSGWFARAPDADAA